jgi:hypothetical protein
MRRLLPPVLAAWLIVAVLSPDATAHRPTDPPHQLYAIGDFTLEGGPVVKDFAIAYVTRGTLNAKQSNAILMVTALTGNHHRLDFLIGPGKELLNPEWEPLEAARYIRDVRTVTITRESVTGHCAAGGFLPPDVEQINAEVEVEQFVEVVTQRAAN